MKVQSRRVAMTKKMIKEALITLLDDNDISRISISDVCALADVNRSTFYSHYTGLKEVLTDIEDDIIARLPVVETAERDLRAAMKSMLSFIKENSELIMVMVIKRKDDSFMEKLIISVLSRYEHLSRDENKTETRLKYLFCISGIVGIIKEWISTDFAISLDSFVDIALSLAVKVTA